VKIAESAKDEFYEEKLKKLQAEIKQINAKKISNESTHLLQTMKL